MIDGKPIFEFAIYRKSPDELYQEYKARFEKEVHYVEKHLPQIHYRETDDYKSHQIFFWEQNGSPYPYNQIIGWVRLIPGHHHVIGVYFQNISKRLTYKSIQRPIHWQGQAFCIYFDQDASGSKIVSRIQDELLALTASGVFKGRYIDLNIFLTLAPYVDWRTILRLE